MAIAEQNYIGDGATTIFPFAFDYINQADIKATVDKQVAPFTLSTSSSVQFSSPPASGTQIRIFRETPAGSLLATFFPGSSIRAQDLNNGLKQILYSLQEIVERSVLKIDAVVAGTLNMGGFRIINLGPPVATTDAVTKSYVDTKLADIVFPANTGYVVYPLLKKAKQIQRFDPLFWRVDGPRSMSFCATPYGNGVEAFFVARRRGDLCGLIWDSESSKDHKYTSYKTNKDYSGLTWSFDIDIASTCPALNEPGLAPTLTVEATVNGTPTTYYIALKNYAGANTDQPVRQATITINWDTVLAGFTPSIPVNPTNINKIFLSCIASDYIENDTTPLAAPVEGYYRLTNITCTGAGTTLDSDEAFVAPHALGMATSYDDMYDLNPARVIRNCWILGYRDWINHYCGVSTYPTRFWNAEAGRFVNEVAGANPAVNPACKKWHEAFAVEAKKYNYKLIYAVSYEYFSEIARDGTGGTANWIQVDWDGNPGVTGYTPTTYFFSLTNPDGMAYLKQVFLEFAATLASSGQEVIMQVGEPWWWYNPGTRKPTIYDYTTRVAFNNATGLFMADVGTIDNALTLSGSPYDEQITFLKTTLGESVQSIRTHIKTTYPDAKVCPLIFLPTILDERAGVMQKINFPVTEYSYPNFEFCMTENYDWIVEGQQNKSYEGMDRAITDLKYPPNLVQYLGGFVNLNVEDPVERRSQWRLIIGNIKNNERYNIQKQHIWAYPQVMRDSITILDQNDNLAFYFGDDQTTVVRQDPPSSVS